MTTPLAITHSAPKPEGRLVNMIEHGVCHEDPANDRHQSHQNESNRAKSNQNTDPPTIF